MFSFAKPRSFLQCRFRLAAKHPIFPRSFQFLPQTPSFQPHQVFNLTKMSPSKVPHVLFLTTHDPEQQAENSELSTGLSKKAIDVTLLSWLSPVLNPTQIANTFTHICFMLTSDYKHHIHPFYKLLTDVLPAAQALNPTLIFSNSLELTAWNANKTYLADIQDAGFRIPRTVYLPGTPSLQELHSALASFHSKSKQSAPVVLKLSVGAGGAEVGRVSNPMNPTKLDDIFLQSLIHQTNEYRTIMLQEFIPEIMSKGEWSLIYIQGRFIGGSLKTVSKKGSGEFRTQYQFGGRWVSVNDGEVPDVARKKGREVWEWMEGRFGEGSCMYVRVDGVVVDDEEFAFMGMYSFVVRGVWEGGIVGLWGVD